MVLLKGVDEQGFVFYTNKDSQRGESWASHAKAALVFHWKSLNRQIRVRGTVEHVTDAEADAYFATRPKQAQIGAWASKQSAPLESRLAFEKAVTLYSRQVRARRRAAAAAMVGLSHRTAQHRILARPGLSGCTTASNSAAPAPARHGARRGFIRELKGSHGPPRNYMPTSPSNQPRRTLLLTGASRGIGHATVKRFSPPAGA